MATIKSRLNNGFFGQAQIYRAMPLYWSARGQANSSPSDIPSQCRRAVACVAVFSGAGDTPGLHTRSRGTEEIVEGKIRPILNVLGTDGIERHEDDLYPHIHGLCTGGTICTS